MSRHRLASVSLASAAFVAVTASWASADPLGTFRWQFAPYCNVVTLYAVLQENNMITLSGTDDQCGAPIAAAASGTAHVNPNGSITAVVSVTRPDGIVLSSSIEVNLATTSGPWKDDFGNSGTFQFDPPSPVTGDPRRVTLKGVYSAGFTAPDAGAIQGIPFSFGKTLPTPPAAPAANIIPFGGPPTTTCPGSFENPQALPGQLCLYERSRENATYQVANSAGDLNVGDTLGAHLFVTAQAAAAVAVGGAWAVTIP